MRKIRTYVVDAKDYKDAVRKVKRLDSTRNNQYKIRVVDDIDYSRQDLTIAQNDTKKAIEYLNKALKDLDNVKTPINATREILKGAIVQVNKALNTMADDKSYQKTYKKVEEQNRRIDSKHTKNLKVVTKKYKDSKKSKRVNDAEITETMSFDDWYETLSPQWQGRKNIDDLREAGVDFENYIDTYYDGKVDGDELYNLVRFSPEQIIQDLGMVEIGTLTSSDLYDYSYDEKTEKIIDNEDEETIKDWLEEQNNGNYYIKKDDLELLLNSDEFYEKFKDDLKEEE